MTLKKTISVCNY